MGTNFYLHKIPTEKEIKEIHEAIDRRDFDEARFLMSKSTKVIHIGKRSCGWQFHFDIHRNKDWEDCEDGMEILPEDFCLERIKEYILEKIKSGWELKDEYGELFTPDQFWNEEVSDILYCDEKHHNIKSYYEKYPEKYECIIENTEFTSKDGLRFDTRWFS